MRYDLAVLAVTDHLRVTTAAVVVVVTTGERVVMVVVVMVVVEGRGHMRRRKNRRVDSLRCRHAGVELNHCTVVQVTHTNTDTDRSAELG